jgi:predicted phosphoribosyltransferase
MNVSGIAIGVLALLLVSGCTQGTPETRDLPTTPVTGGDTVQAVDTEPVAESEEDAFAALEQELDQLSDLSDDELEQLLGQEG